MPRALAELFSAYVAEVADTRPRRVAEARVSAVQRGRRLARRGDAAERSLARDGHASAHENGGSPVTDDTERQQIRRGAAWSSPICCGRPGIVGPNAVQRTDGICLLYPGMVHSIHGEPESGKSLIMQAECVRLLSRNEEVLYLDFDADEMSVVERLLDLGADPQSIDKHFDYRHPETKPDSPEERQAWDEMVSSQYALVVIDGVTDALGIFGYSTKDNDDVARWIREVPKLIAARTGAAVVLIDHVTKESGNRGRLAIGGQAKMAGLTGAAYTAEVAAPLGRGLRGEVVLRIGKDRPGAVRPHCGSFSKKDRTQEAARIVIDSTVDPPTVLSAHRAFEEMKTSASRRLSSDQPDAARE